ncbi:MAG: WYL domain-containing protein, partial [Clostridia bacterium]|nr:WYL domain-containing protein [Clostridia bacterium]
MSEKKNLSVIILEILKKHSSEEKRLKKSDIIRLLKEEYGRESDPRTVNSSLLSLIELGYPIGANISKRYGTRSEWYLKKTLSDAEVNAVMLGIKTSEYILPEEKEALADKIKELFLTSSYGEKVLASQNCKSTVNNTYTLLFAIYKAIEDGYMLSFSILNYKTESRKHFEEQNRRIVQYLLKPISIVEGGGRLYLFGELADTGIYRYFPLDRIYGLKQTTIPFDFKYIR